MQQYMMRDYCNTFTILKISCWNVKSSRNLFDIPIHGLPLKLRGAVCLSSAKLLGIIFPTSILRISANFYFYIQNEKLENKKIINKIKVLQYLNVTTLANHCRTVNFISSGDCGRHCILCKCDDTSSIFTLYDSYISSKVHWTWPFY